LQYPPPQDYETGNQRPGEKVEISGIYRVLEGIFGIPLYGIKTAVM
jgi:hypothetical protein